MTDNRRVRRVRTCEIWTQDVYVLSSSNNEAIKIVADAGGVVDEDGLEYSHRCSPEHWDVSELSGTEADWWRKLILRREEEERMLMARTREEKDV